MHGVMHCRYTFRSQESQLRVLADYAMMLQDFLLAHENYRLLASDFRRDKAWKHYAGAQVRQDMGPLTCKDAGWLSHT